ncbi:hypothetical protein TRFO_30388 [Tritrichomonas foetus]|uniref:Uncharacterized protein n=1 Tax=Tritrichomonas foetus TaxID=1144522 RepID=A0A1J4JYC5_9EUKA|nr:hypothetical protein TRFO_30388 [Tritrichomonas foetus]|eukprot:OHT02494.1 hypothetical protein TRFO_30388 [Tritrichomonas foetus]
MEVLVLLDDFGFFSSLLFEVVQERFEFGLKPRMLGFIRFEIRDLKKQIEDLFSQDLLSLLFFLDLFEDGVLLAQLLENLAIEIPDHYFECPIIGRGVLGAPLAPSPCRRTTIRDINFAYIINLRHQQQCSKLG